MIYKYDIIMMKKPFGDSKLKEFFFPLIYLNKPLFFVKLRVLFIILTHFSNLSRFPENQQTSEKEETPKKDKESSPHPESETDKQSEPSPYKDPPPTEESDKELSPLKDLSNSMKNKEIMNNNKDECSPADNSKMDKDSMIGDCDANLSDLESEGTQPEEVSSTLFQSIKVEN